MDFDRILLGSSFETDITHFGGRERGRLGLVGNKKHRFRVKTTVRIEELHHESTKGNENSLVAEMEQFLT